MRKSHKETLKSLSIIGSANALEYICGLIRIKLIAIFLGPTGIGLISLYNSIISVLGTATGLGLNSSAVREISLNQNEKTENNLAYKITILRRVFFAAGIFGWITCAALSSIISQIIFTSKEYTLSIGALGAVLLFNSIYNCEKAILQGQRLVKQIAHISILSTIANTGISIGIYYFFREKGIIISLISTAILSYLVSIHITCKLNQKGSSSISLVKTFETSKQLIKFGAAFMFTALFSALVEVLIRLMISRNFGLNAVGIHQAAWSLSGIFAGFLLNSMGVDFYPKLTKAIHDKEAVREIVNGQTELGILIAIPGLLGTITFAPKIISIFYSSEFSTAADLLIWFTLGVFGKVISWPLGYILVAQGRGKLFVFTESSTLVFQIITTYFLLEEFGLPGTGYAFVCTYIFYTLLLLNITKKTVQFKWEKSLNILVLLAILIIITNLLLIYFDIPFIIILGHFLISSSFFLRRIYLNTKAKKVHNE